MKITWEIGKKSIKKSMESVIEYYQAQKKKLYSLNFWQIIGLEKKNSNNSTAINVTGLQLHCNKW